MMRVFLAVLTDSIRYLRSRFLFWLTLGLSALAAIALFGLYQFTPEGLKILWFKPIENPQIAEGTPGRTMLVTGLFNGFFVKFWLGWGAMILAVVSTAGILPDFLRDGSIELSLSRPIRRWKLLLMKISGSLMFVLVQVSIAITFAWALIGLKFDIWVNDAFIAVPLLALQFVYLYAFSTFLGVLTRSTLMALIGTVLLWFAVFMVQFVSNQLDTGLARTEFMREQLIERRERSLAAIDSLGREPNGLEVSRLARLDEEVAQHERTLEWLSPWSSRAGTLELMVPKTGDLQKLVSEHTKAPVSNEFFGLLFDFDNEDFRPSGVSEEEWQLAQDADTEGQRAARTVEATVSIGSSLGACALLYGIAIWRFSRRDF